MANIQVEVQANLLYQPIKIRALIANACSKTQISRRLAIKLGLFEDAKDIFVKDEGPLSNDQWVGRWKISLKPVMITCYPSKRVQTKNGGGIVVVAGYPLYH